MEKDLTLEEKTIVASQIQKNLEYKYSRGKMIIKTMTIANILLAIANYFLSFNVAILTMQLILAVALMVSSKWVKQLFAVGSVLVFTNMVYSLFVFGFTLPPLALSFVTPFFAPIILPPFNLSLIFLTTVYCLASTIFLFKSESVSEFLYCKRLK